MTKITEDKKQTIYSKILNGLRYQILIGNGIMISTGIFNPYLFAKQEHKVIFQHINKLNIKKPTVLIYIIHPWFSENSISVGFENSKVEALRSIARRIFMQYKDKEINIEKKENSIPLCNPFKYLSGLIFIVDNSLKGEQDEIYLFKNPNAIHKLPDSFVMHFHDFQTYYDDFEYDNY